MRPRRTQGSRAFECLMPSLPCDPQGAATPCHFPCLANEELDAINCKGMACHKSQRHSATRLQRTQPSPCRSPLVEGESKEFRRGGDTQRETNPSALPTCARISGSARSLRVGAETWKLAEKSRRLGLPGASQGLLGQGFYPVDVLSACPAVGCPITRERHYLCQPLALGSY